VHLEGLVPFLVEGELHCLIRKIRQEPKRGIGMTKKVADLLVDVLAEAGSGEIYGVSATR